MKSIYKHCRPLLVIASCILFNVTQVNYTLAQTRINLPSISGDEAKLVMPDCRYQRSPREEAGLSLLKAVCIAVERHPSIASAVAAHSGQSDMIDAAEAGYYPQVSVNMQTTRDSDSSSYATGPKLSVQQRVYDFGKVSSAVDQAKGQVERQRANLLQQIDSIIQQTGDAVITVKRLEEIELRTLSMIKGVKKVADIADSRAGAGLSTQSDSIQAQARLEAAEASLLNTRTELRKARVRLLTLLGRQYQDASLGPITDHLFNETIFKFKVDPKQIPSIIAAEANRSVAEAQLASADAELYPTISVVGSTEKTLTGNNPNTGERRGTYNYIGLSLDQKLFSGGERTARKRSAAQMLNSATYDIDTALLNLNDQAESLREYIVGTKGRLKVLQARKDSINRTRILYQEQYTLGSRPVLDLLNAEQEMFQAESDEVNALYDMWSFYMQYVVITGNARRLFNLNAVVQASLGSH